MGITAVADPMIESRERLSIRAARNDDAESLAALATQLGYPTDTETMRRRLDRVRELRVGEVFVGTDASGRVVGWAHGVPRLGLEDEPYVELAGLVVDESARGGGVGAALLRAVEAWTRDQGYARVRVRSNAIRERAHRFYLREGYSEAKQQKLFNKIVG